jgi:membrane-associated protease RseP (regulator of RpoE activity)
LGISADQRFEGEGIRIEEVQKDSPAAEAGLQPGDVIVKMGEKDVPAGPAGLLGLRAYLEGLQGGEAEFTVKRGEQTLTLKTKPRVIDSDKPPPELGYGKPSGRVRAEVTAPNRIEVKTRGVSALRLHLARPLVDPGKEVVVLLNGKEAFKGVPSSDAPYLLDQALRGLPGDPLFEAHVTLRP